MKSLLLAFAILSCGVFAKAQNQTPTHILRQGDSRYVFDVTTNQYVNILCESARPVPVPPPVPVPHKICEILFNPPSDSCNYYRVYINGSQGSECLSSLELAVRTMNSMRANGVCAVRRAASPCDMRFNPPSDSCNHYRIYIAGKQSSECLADLSQAESTLRQLREANLCY